MRTGHFLSISNFSKKEIWQIFKTAVRMKKELKRRGLNRPVLDRISLAMIFEKPSLRTRVSFEVGMTQLGGHALYLGPQDIQMGKRETPGDIGQNLSRMVNIIMARVFDHRVLVDLANGSSVPVINALSDLEHPCQVMADLLTVWEHKGKLEGLTLVYSGDGENNVTHSLALICTTLGVNFRCVSPKGYKMKKEVVEMVKKNASQSGAEFLETEDLSKALKGADIVVTDTWVSMGDEAEAAKRIKVFPPYQINQKAMSLAKKDAIFLHCLPAYRGKEVTPEVIDGPQSVVFDEAENRLHAQKAIILYLLGIKY